MHHHYKQPLLSLPPKLWPVTCDGTKNCSIGRISVSSGSVRGTWPYQRCLRPRGFSLPRHYAPPQPHSTIQYHFCFIIHIIYRVFIKYCVFPKILKYSGLWLFSVFPRCQCVYTHQAGRTPRCSRTGRVQKNYKILRKNTIFNEHPVCSLKGFNRKLKYVCTGC